MGIIPGKKIETRKEKVRKKEREKMERDTEGEREGGRKKEMERKRERMGEREVCFVVFACFVRHCLIGFVHEGGS